MYNSQLNSQTRHGQRGRTYQIVSRAAYLLGVGRQVFASEREPLKIEVYEELRKDPDARVIRNLCRVRTAIEQNYTKIHYEFHYNMKNLTTLPEIIPQECLMELERDGVSLYRANHKIQDYLIDINGLIQRRIASCRRLFPEWVNWTYIKELFLMPDGLSEKGLKAAASQYYANMGSCPYQAYINWRWDGTALGNVLYNDEKFLTLLYQSHHDSFTDLSKVSDAGEQTKQDVRQFLEDGKHIVMVVDCENSDPYKLYAVLNNLRLQGLDQKIDKIILCDDSHTATAWGILDRFTSIPVEHELIVRIKAGKSLVDPKLVAKVCREVYQRDVDSVILFASDSDYWGMVSEVTEANYLIMVESGKCGPDLKKTLMDAGIPYAYIDDFCTGSSYSMKISAVTAELRRRLDAFHLDLQSILEDSVRAARADMSTNELQQFYDRYVRPMRLSVSKSGQASLELGG